MKDIGCCVGYFCHKAAENYSMNAIGIDLNNRYLRIAEYTKSYVDNGNKEIFLNMNISEETVDILPKTDVTVLFSVWHHWVFHYGLEKSTEILQKVWSNTNNVLLFESGEEETKSEFNLPFDKKANEWLLDYLENNLKPLTIEMVGEFSVGDYAHYKIKEHKRTVYAIVK